MQTNSSKLVVEDGNIAVNGGGGNEFGVSFKPWVGIVVLLVSVYASGKYRYRWQTSNVEYTYRNAWVKGELWRTGLASIAHADVPHLVYSLLGVWWTGMANRGKGCAFFRNVLVLRLIYMAASLFNISVQV